MQLVIDTSTDMASIALVEGDAVLAESIWLCEQSHSQELLPHLVQLLEQAGLSLQSADCIIVARGPGGFNGLRVGISTAKGLTFSLDIPIIGVSNLEVAAYQHADSGLPVCAVLQAGRREVATAMYQKKDGKWSQLITEHITTVDELCLRISSETIFCGEYAPAITERLREKLGQKAIVPSPATSSQRLALLSRLGRLRASAGDYDDPVTLQPLYLRRPQITEPKHRH
ncbi:tRNA (adenosine(37)-N6)-threonylcarbamoyltransferase complex dimerization subunit type 1 TsaB [Chloroflexota bacterium]